MNGSKQTASSWASSNIIGCNTRRYHRLLVAATVPPAERMSLVSKLDETIITGDERFELSTNNYGNAIHPNGYQYLTSFSKDLFPEFIYEASGVKLKKTIAMVYSEKTSSISSVKNPPQFTKVLPVPSSARVY